MFTDKHPDENLDKRARIFIDIGVDLAALLRVESKRSGQTYNYIMRLALLRELKRREQQRRYLKKI